MNDHHMIIEIINYVYGIDYIQSNDILSSIDLNKKLELMGVDPKKVIFSTCLDDYSKNTWIIAGFKYYDNDEVQKIIEFMIDNQMYMEYFMGDL